MFIVVVNFIVNEASAAEFRTAVMAQAENSVAREAGCHVFDVAAPAGKETEFLLYEVYDDAAAFDAHMASRHFKDFDAKVAPWVASKTVQTYERIWTAP